MDSFTMISTISGLMSAISSAVAIYIAVQTSSRQELHQRDSLEWQKEQNRAQLKLTMDAKMMDWGARVLTCLNEIELFVQISSEHTDVRKHRKAQLMCALSELVDEGRWHMPNHTDPRNPDHGKDKGAAYSGYRTRALDALVYIYDRLKTFESSGRLSPEELVQRLHDSKRVFVSAVFLRIDPKRFLKLIEVPQDLPQWMNLSKAA